MNNMDMTAHWELLVPHPIPVPVTDNEDDSLQPPIERDDPVNPKCGYGDQFIYQLFLGTVEKLPTKVNTRRRHQKNLCNHSKKRGP